MSTKIEGYPGQKAPVTPATNESNTPAKAPVSIHAPARGATKRLTMKQANFARAYVETHGNATEAVAKSYPDLTTRPAQGTHGHYLLTQCPNVLAEVERIMTEKGITVSSMSEELSLIVKNRLNPAEQNKAIRTGLEMQRVIGSGSSVAVQINVQVPDSVDLIRKALVERFDNRPVIDQTLDHNTQVHDNKDDTINGNLP